MIERYTRPRMKAIWDLRHKYEIWLDVELLACEALERTGEVPRGVGIHRQLRRLFFRQLARIEQQIVVQRVVCVFGA